MNCDLHTHSVYSDGSLTPAQLVAEAKKRQLILALTDHNTTAGLPEFMQEAQRQDVTAVPGIELSTQYGEKELHLLGLFVKPEHYALLEELCKAYYAKKERSNQQLISRLNAAGYSISYEDIRRDNPHGNINRAHVARELLRRGYVASVKQAFDRLLKAGGGFYEPPQRLLLEDGIKLFRSIGAVPVLAHPLQELTYTQLQTLLPRAVEAGLLGMEVLHSAYSAEQICLAKQLARQFALQESGGSDFHGEAKPAVQMGVGEGKLQIPQAYYEALRALACCDSPGESR